MDFEEDDAFVGPLSPRRVYCEQEANVRVAHAIVARTTRAVCGVDGLESDEDEQYADSDEESLSSVEVNEGEGSGIALCGEIPAPYGTGADKVTFERIIVTDIGEEISEEKIKVCTRLQQAREMRAKYMNYFVKPMHNWGGLNPSAYTGADRLPEAQHRALYMASSGTDTGQIRYLLGIGADPNWRHPKSGRTALHKAAKQGLPENVQILLKAYDPEGQPVDVNVVEQKGYTPLDRALAEGHSEVVQLLRAAGGNEGSTGSVSRALYDAVDSGEVKKVERLLDAKADPNWVNPSNGRVALHKAAKQGLLMLMELLLAHEGEGGERADVNVLEHKGFTPLDRALGAGHAQIAELLRAAGGKEGSMVASAQLPPPAPGGDGGAAVVAGGGGSGVGESEGDKRLFTLPARPHISTQRAQHGHKLRHKRRAELPYGPLDCLRQPVSPSASSPVPAPASASVGVKVPGPSGHTFAMVAGLMHVYEPTANGAGDGAGAGAEAGAGALAFEPPPSMEEYYRDLHTLKQTYNDGPVKSFAFRQLQLLEARFKLHQLLNAERELEAQKAVPHRDFYNVRKVDTHVHHSACMNQKHLLSFIKHKLENDAGEKVIERDGRRLSLKEVFRSLGLNIYNLSIDTLDMHADNTFHRFDRFNLKYNPAGQSRLREIFLKTDNYIGGRYLAEITREVEQDLRGSKYQMAEWRVSVYGRKRNEWSKLARWFCTHRLEDPQVRWLIQIPRLYYIYKKIGMVDCFQDMLDNIFVPLFEVSADPSSDPPLHAFLSTVVGFDCVDDESKPEVQVNYQPDGDGGDRSDPASNGLPPTPPKLDGPENPPYTYWCYYLYANMAVLNRFRASRGLSTFEFRPHCGEAGNTEHLSAAFLCAHQINHGLVLRKAAALEYLYYLDQVGVAMSPLSNNKLFLEYHRNPFPTYFARGLNVSLSTDDPLMLHYTKDALLEEYSVAGQVYKFSSADLCEMARNSVLQSGFEHPFKAHWLGPLYARPGAEGNDIKMSNVPNIRVTYRHEMLTQQREFIQKHAVANGGK